MNPILKNHSVSFQQIKSMLDLLNADIIYSSKLCFNETAYSKYRIKSNFIWDLENLHYVIEQE